MKVRDVRVRPQLVPMAEPHRTASGVITESPLVLTELTTDEGVVGYSVVFTYTAAALGPTADLTRNIGSLLSDQPLAPVHIYESLAARFRLLGTHGLVGMALSALDMAAWDALARAHNTSLIALHGGQEKQVPAYGAVGFDGASASAAVAERWAQRGFRGVKAKIGYPTVAEDLAVIRAMRTAIGPDIAIMVDYNQSLMPAEAIERLSILESEGLTWIEEPVLSHDFKGHAEVARAIRTPIQSGENWWGPLDVRHAIEAGSSDFLMLDVMKVGGVTGWLRAAATAATHSIRVSSHLWPEISAQLLCLSPTAHWLEYADWWNPVLAEPLEIQNGYANLSGVRGSGVSFKQS